MIEYNSPTIPGRWELGNNLMDRAVWKKRTHSSFEMTTEKFLDCGLLFGMA